VWVNVCHNFTDIQVTHVFLNTASNFLTVRRTTPNTQPSVAAKSKIESMIKCWKNPYRQRYKSDMSLRHTCDHKLKDCPAKQLFANNKGIL
jgi:hypothetical protein